MIFKRNRPGGLSCRQVGRNLQAFLDQESLANVTAAQLEEHLELCRQCGLEADTYRSIKDSLARAGTATENPSGLQRLRAFGQQLVEDDSR